jgi:hypothetical protein
MSICILAIDLAQQTHVHVGDVRTLAYLTADRRNVGSAEGSCLATAKICIVSRAHFLAGSIMPHLNRTSGSLGTLNLLPAAQTKRVQL